LTYDVAPVSFDRPPVAEVALSVQTSPAFGVQAAHLGAFWETALRDAYPVTQDQPAAPPSIESFDDGGWRPVIIFGTGAPSSRQWYLTEDQTRLVQMQNDRIVLNWRRLQSTDYPHYAALRAELERVTSLWQTFTDERRLPRAPVVQTEVTYINQIPLEEPITDLSDVGAVLSALRLTWPENAGTPELFQFEQRFRLSGPDGRPARLYVTLAPGSLPDDRPFLSLNLVARGAPAGQGMQAALTWLDFGHNQIVNTFADITAAGMREGWGQHADRSGP